MWQFLVLVEGIVGSIGEVYRNASWGCVALLVILGACGDDSASDNDSTDGSTDDSADASREPDEPMDGDAADGAASGQPDATAQTDASVEPGVSEWRMMGYDPGSTYLNSAETVLTKDNAASLEEAYTVDMGGNVYGAPLLIGDRVYASGPADVRALEAANGDEIWRVSLTSTASLAYDDGKLFANRMNGTVVALDAESGDELWSTQPDSGQVASGTSSPVVGGGLVFIGGSNGGAELSTGAFRGFLAALDPDSGDVAWLTHTVPEDARGAAIWSTVSIDVAANRVYAGTGNNYGPPATDSSDSIIAFELDTGTIEWKNQRVENDTFGAGNFAGGPDFDFGANPVLYETMVDGTLTKLASAGAKSGAAHAVRRDDGELVWTRSLCSGSANGSQGIFTNSTWTGRYMLFGCNEGGPATLYALDGATGDIVWERELPGLVWGRISVANGVGFVGTGTNLEVFDVDSGDLIKSIPSKGGTVASTISIANGRVAFGEGLSWSGGLRGTVLTVLEVP